MSVITARAADRRFEVLRRTVRQFKRDEISDRAAGLTYFGILAIFPGLLALVSIMGLIGQHNAQRVLDNLTNVVPSGVNTFLHSVVQQVQGRAGAASVAAIAGILVALWSASSYVAAFTRAANAIYGLGEGRPVWRTLPVRIGVTVALTIMLVASMVIIVVTGPVANQVGHALGIGHGAVTAWSIAKWPVLLLFVVLMLSLLYWACPNVKQGRPRLASPGSAIAVAVWLVASGLFALYVAFSGSYNKTYGSFAAVIIFLVWLWLSNVAVLFGLEFDAERQRQHLLEAGFPDDVQPFVQPRDTRKLDEQQLQQVDEAEQIRRATTYADY